MDTFNQWFSRFMFATEIIFLAASMPHIAAWFAHFDTGQQDWYAWGIGYALAFAIDGVSFMLLLAITRMVKTGSRNGWVIIGLLLFMAFIATLSGFINWQYDVQYASNAFAKADTLTVAGFSVGAVNPIIGGSFQILILAYALISKVVSAKEKTAEELKEEADNLEKTAVQKRRLNALKKKQSEEKLDGAFGMVGGVIARAKKVGKQDELGEVTQEKPGAISEETEEETGEENEEKPGTIEEGNEEETGEKTARKAGGNEEETSEESWVKTIYPDTSSWLDRSGTTVSLHEVAKTMNISMKRLGNCVERKEVRKTKPKANGEVMVDKKSVVAWVIASGVAAGKSKVTPFKVVRNTDELEAITEEEIAQ